MEGTTLFLTNNGLCLFCLCEVKHYKNHLFPLHHLTSKINTDLGNVFKDIVAPEAPLPLLDRMEMMAVACQGCYHLCEEFLYKYQDGAKRANCLGEILDKMDKAEVEDKHKNWSPLAVFYSEIANRLRKEIKAKLQLQFGERSSQSATQTLDGFRRIPSILKEGVIFLIFLWKMIVEKFNLQVGEKPNQSVEEAPAGLPIIPNLLDIPELPMEKICSYLDIKDIKNLSSVSKALRPVVFRSLIKSSFITFHNRSQLPALISFIKEGGKDIKKNIKLLLRSNCFDDSEEGRSTLLQLFQEYGSQLSHLKLVYVYTRYQYKVRNGFRNNNSIPVLGIGNELFPNMTKLDINFFLEQPKEGLTRKWDFRFRGAYNSNLDTKYQQQQFNDCLPFVKAVFGNSPVLKELKLYCNEMRSDLLFKLIGESGLRLDNLEVTGTFITAAELGYLHSLNLKRVVLGELNLEDPQALTNFLETQRNTLKYLEWSWGEGIIPHFRFPRMKNLETCKLRKTLGIFTPISYKTQLPRLKEIELENVQPVFLPDDGEPSYSVWKLSILKCSYFANCHIVEAAGVFKCLTKLEIPVVEELFECWKDFVSLEELTLYPSWKRESTETITLIDGSISGVDVKKYSGKGTEEDIQKYAEEYEKVKTESSLALLTRLRLLRLRRGLEVGDVGCKLVLMQMESLKYIDFCGVHPRLVGASSKVLDEMGQKVDLMFGNIREWP